MRYRGQQLPYEPHRKLRTTEHIAADLSYNFLERKVLQRGHWLDAPVNDYGIDATMFHHNERGEIENGEVRFQLKARQSISIPKGKGWFALRTETRDLKYWAFELFPAIVVVFDVSRDVAYWLHIQHYVYDNPNLLASETQTISLRVAVPNKLTLKAVDRFRQLSLDVVRSNQSGRNIG